MSDASSGPPLLVPILGRPNVGKSTLFNRLVGEPRAVVGPEPGVTRDRVSEPLTWEGRTLTLIDTAGYQEDGGSPDPAFLLDQAEAMIETGECLLFVVDARSGLTRLDRRIADRLCPHSDRVILVVNKVDPGVDPPTAASAFHELGFAETITVSAEHGRGVGALRRRVLEHLPESDEKPPPSEGIRLALVGRPNVGKSTLFNAVLGYERVMVSEEPGTTRDLITVSFRVRDRRFTLMDTVGMRRRARVDPGREEKGVAQSIRALSGCDVAALVFDWQERVTRQDQRIAGLIQDRYRGCLLLVNKADEPDEENERRWMNHLRNRLHFLDHATVLFTSGRTRRGLGAVFRQAGSIYDEMHRVFESRQLDRALLDVKSSLDWPSRTGREVILQEIRQEDVNPVTLAVKARHAEGMTRRDLRHLRRRLRGELGLEHSPLKLRMVEESADVS